MHSKYTYWSSPSLSLHLPTHSPKRGRNPKIDVYFKAMTNSTLVTEFLLEVFAETWELRLLLSMLFLLVYLGSLLGNLTIIIATTVDHNLNTPMYFFLRNLSILDMYYVSVTVPNACINSLTNHKSISVAGCAAQIFLVFFCACVEILFLAVMAQDRYVAICKPLLYPLIMNHQFCVQMTLTSLLSSFVIAGVNTIKIFQLTFCNSNVVQQFFCDTPSLLRISCSDTFNNKLLILLSAIGVSGTSFMYTIVPPFLNLIIYSLRNKQIKEAVKKVPVTHTDHQEAVSVVAARLQLQPWPRPPHRSDSDGRVCDCSGCRGSFCD
ncbi:olfactory receptor 14C36-like [Sigmodon hispidus]